MIDRDPAAYKVDDLIIDSDTGEVLELPQNAGDKAEFLTYRLVELQNDERAYKQAIMLIKLALKRELETLDLKSLQTQYGRPVIRSRVTRKGMVERLAGVMAQYELSYGQAQTILTCASALDPEKLDIIAEGDVSIPDEATIPREAIEALIEEKTSEWLQVSPILREPPVVEKL